MMIVFNLSYALVPRRNYMKIKPNKRANKWLFMVYN